MPRFSLTTRAAGVLLHPTSLPGRNGCGDLGPAARAFVDFLAAAGQRWWQMLPINPIGGGNAPYDSPSAFAGNPLLVSLEDLVDQGLLRARDARPGKALPAGRVNFPATIAHRDRALRAAHRGFDHDAGPRQRRAFETWCAAEADWLDPFALFMAIRRSRRNRSWQQWPRDLAAGKPRALQAVRTDLAGEFDYIRFTQWLFDRHWAALRKYAAARGVGLIGDVPIFVSLDSADVWAHRNLFQLDARGRPTVVSGCPPDSFSKDGQLWGHPLFRWSAHARTGFRWWIDRIGAVARRFDATRIDHFIGFHNCWAVPGRARTARNGKWTPSPGRELFKALRKALGRRLEIVAEDLGAMTDGVRALRDGNGFPGMRIMQNGFHGYGHYDEPHRWPPHCVAYTGTHDNDTTAGWFAALPKRGSRNRGPDGLLTRTRLLRYTAGRERTVVWDMIRWLYGSPANTVIVPLQDVLGLGSEARMNVPGTPRGNWEWRYPARALRATHADRLAELSATYERTAG